MKFIPLLECDKDGMTYQHIVINFDHVLYFEPAAQYMQGSEFFSSADDWLEMVDNPDFAVTVLHFDNGTEKLVNESASRIIKKLNE